MTHITSQSWKLHPCFHFATLMNSLRILSQLMFLPIQQPFSNTLVIRERMECCLNQNNHLDARNSQKQNVDTKTYQKNLCSTRWPRSCCQKRPKMTRRQITTTRVSQTTDIQPLILTLRSVSATIACLVVDDLLPFDVLTPLQYTKDLPNNLMSQFGKNTNVNFDCENGFFSTSHPPKRTCME